MNPTIKTTKRVKEILSWYKHENTGTLTNIARMLYQGTTGGSGRMVILPVDQGFEHGPTRSFEPNPAAYDPRFHFELAIAAGCSAYAAPLGALEAAAADFPAEIPLILKLNSSTSLVSGEPCPAITSSIEDALRLGASAVGFTIYPGSEFSNLMYEQLRDLILEAKSAGLAVVVWSYPRGKFLSKEGETAIDIVAYAAHLACLLGANIVKVKLPTEHVEQKESQKIYQEYPIILGRLSQRVSYIVRSCFNGRRVVIFSGGPAKGEDEILQEVGSIMVGGGFGSIIGRNSFQREKPAALKLLRAVMDVYAKSAS